MTVVMCGFVVVAGCSSDAESPAAAPILSSYVEPSAGVLATPPPAPTPTSAPLPETATVSTMDNGFRGVLSSSIAPGEWPLQVKLHGAEQGRLPLLNGGAIRLEENLTAELFVDPMPTDTLTAWIDLYLVDDAGDPVPDAKVVIDYDMYSMAHGPFFSLADKRPDGHYIFRLDYIMFGPWGQLLHIEPKGSDEEHDLEITIIAEP